MLVTLRLPHLITLNFTLVSRRNQFVVSFLMPCISALYLTVPITNPSIMSLFYLSYVFYELFQCARPSYLLPRSVLVIRNGAFVLVGVHLALIAVFQLPLLQQYLGGSSGTSACSLLGFYALFSNDTNLAAHFSYAQLLALYMLVTVQATAYAQNLMASSGNQSVVVPLLGYGGSLDISVFFMQKFVTKRIR